MPWQVPTKILWSIRDMLKFRWAISRLVGIARGEQEYFDPSGIPTATEACKSNALMRCCKDLGIASELWYASWNAICVSTLTWLPQGSTIHPSIQSRPLRRNIRRARHNQEKVRGTSPFNFITTLICMLGRSYGEGKTNLSWIIPGRSDLQNRSIYLFIIETLVSHHRTGPRCTSVTIDPTSNATTHFKRTKRMLNRKLGGSHNHSLRSGDTVWKAQGTNADILSLRLLKEQINNESLYTTVKESENKQEQTKT